MVCANNGKGRMVGLASSTPSSSSSWMLNSSSSSSSSSYLCGSCGSYCAEQEMEVVMATPSSSCSSCEPIIIIIRLANSKIIGL